MLHIRDNGYHKHNKAPACLSAQLDLSVIQLPLECSCRQAGAGLCFSSPTTLPLCLGHTLLMHA